MTLERSRQSNQPPAPAPPSYTAAEPPRSISTSSSSAAASAASLSPTPFLLHPEQSTVRLGAKVWVLSE
ncbi:unnamed protein product [Gadus morhua 'NCC']